MKVKLWMHDNDNDIEGQSRIIDAPDRAADSWLMRQALQYFVEKSTGNYGYLILSDEDTEEEQR